MGKLAAIIVFLTLFVAVNGNVIGFDFGSTFFKITLVKPGSPFSIVENLTSKRKTETMMTIGNEQRMFSADSFSNNGRYPQQTFTDVAQFLGMEFNEETLTKLKQERYVLNDFVQDERGFVAYQLFSMDKSDDKKVTYYTEEVVAQILKYGRNLAEIQAGGTVKDTVLTVPSYFSQEQRRLFLDAADMAGLHIIQLVHENVAAATMFGIDRMDTEKPLTVLLYNMGGKDTEVTVARFSAIADEKNKTFEYIEIMGEAWDENLGGADFDKVIVEMLAEAFNALPERQGKPDIRKNEKAMKRLFSQSVNVKDILSANKLADVKIPDLLDKITLRTVLARSDFEARSDSIIQKVTAPIDKALEHANLTIADIDQVEILGGGLRVPKVMEVLKAHTGKDLSVHLNGDEAMCFGAAFIAANSSSSFKVRKVFLTQHPRFSYKVQIRPLSEEGLPEQKEGGISYSKDITLYKPAGDYLGQKKTISLTYDRDMSIQIIGECPCTQKEEVMATYVFDGMTEIVKGDIATKEGSSVPKVSLQFELNRSHILSLNKIEVKIDEITLVEKVVEKTKEKVKKEPKKSKYILKEEEAEAEEKKVETEEKVENAEEEAKEEAAPVEVKPIMEEKVIPHVFPFTDLKEKLVKVRLLEAGNKALASGRIKGLEKRDDDKKKNDAAKNDYESLVLEFRSWMSDDANDAYTTQNERDKNIDKCNDGEDWLYGEGSNAGAKEYQSKGQELKSTFNKFKIRKSEHALRQETIPKITKVFEQMRDDLAVVLVSKPWISEQEGTDVTTKLGEIRSWFSDQMDAQEKAGLQVEPVVMMSEVTKRLDTFVKFYKKITDKKKPAEKKQAKVEVNDEEYGEPEKEGASEETTKEKNEQEKASDL